MRFPELYVALGAGKVLRRASWPPLDKIQLTWSPDGSRRNVWKTEHVLVRAYPHHHDLWRPYAALRDIYADDWEVIS